MTQRESKLSSKISRHLREMGVFCFKVWGNEMMMVGLPDIVACVNGLFVGFETKMPGKRGNVSVHQEYTHQRIRDSGGVVYVVCSVAEVEAIITAILANGTPEASRDR